MTYQPALISTGVAGWRFLQRTYETQLDTFSGTPVRQRESAYFLEKIGDVKTAEDLVSDRRLLSVALEAFGLEDDLNNTYFVRKILEDGTSSGDALANRLADKRYQKFSEAFGLGPGEIRKTGLQTFMEDVVNQSETAAFETAVGVQDETMRIALYAQHELQALAGEDMSDTAKWFNLMGVPPLRQMMETALGLPRSFGQLDLDKQLEVFQDKLQRLTGSDSIAQFTEPDSIEQLTVSYLARAQLNAQSSVISSAQTALVLLGAIG